MTTLQLRGSDIDLNSVSCTVSQLVLVFEALARFGATAELVWFGADMSPPMAPYDNDIPYRVGSIDAVIGVLRGLTAPQLDFCVLAGMPSGAALEALAEQVSSEGPPRQRVTNSAIEVVAFDSTFIEITTNDVDTIQAMRNRFGGKIVVP